MPITRRSTIRDVAVQVSQALTDADITAVLTGGAAVSIYRTNSINSGGGSPRSGAAGGG
jgi:hypothetical protein